MGQDELISWGVASRTTGQIVATLHNVDAVHGLYYLLLHFWIKVFGDSLLSMRMPGILGMSTAAMFVTLTARTRFGDRAGAGRRTGVRGAACRHLVRA